MADKTTNDFEVRENITKEYVVEVDYMSSNPMRLSEVFNYVPRLAILQEIKEPSEPEMVWIFRFSGEQTSKVIGEPND